MTRFLLFMLFFVMLVADMLGLNLSLAPGLSIKNAFLYSIFLGIAIETALKRNRRLELLSVIVPYTLYFLYAAFTVVVVILLVDYTGYRPLQSLISLKAGLADNLLVLLVFYYGVLTPKNAMSLMKMIIWTVLVVNIITVVDALNIVDLGLIQARADGRISGPVGESNQYAALLALFLPPILGLALVERGMLRKLALLGFAASVLALLMTASRGGVVGVFLGALAGAFFLRQFITGKNIVRAFVALLILSPIALGAMYFAGFGDLIYERFIEGSSGGSSWEVSSGRTAIWGGALSKMFDQPLSIITGFGWDAYRQAFVFKYAPHNSYLKIFFELGAIGLLPILLALANILRVARLALRQAESNRAIMLLSFVFGFFGLLIAIFFVDIIKPWILIWAFVGVMMRIANPITHSSVSGPKQLHRMASSRVRKVERPI